VAQSNASVAEYMRNIETSLWMGHADLRKTENTHNGTRMPYVFGLDVLLSKPKTDEVDAGKTPVLPAGAGSSATPAVPAALGAAARAATQAPAKPATTATPEATPVSAPAVTGGAGS
jgi:type IV pilus assembly protein PilN